MAAIPKAAKSGGSNKKAGAKFVRSGQGGSSVRVASSSRGRGGAGAVGPSHCAAKGARYPYSR